MSQRRRRASWKSREKQFCSSAPAEQSGHGVASRPCVPQDQRFASTFIFGAVCPHDRWGAAPVGPGATPRRGTCTWARSAAWSASAGTPRCCWTKPDGISRRCRRGGPPCCRCRQTGRKRSPLHQKSNCSMGPGQGELTARPGCARHDRARAEPDAPPSFAGDLSRGRPNSAHNPAPRKPADPPPSRPRPPHARAGRIPAPAPPPRRPSRCRRAW